MLENHEFGPLSQVSDKFRKYLTNASNNLSRIVTVHSKKAVYKFHTFHTVKENLKMIKMYPKTLKSKFFKIFKSLAKKTALNLFSFIESNKQTICHRFFSRSQIIKSLIAPLLKLWPK